MSSYEFWDELGKIFNAVVAYQEKNLEFNKRFISPWIRLGNVFEKQDRNKEAINAYERAIEIDGGNPQNWFELGNIHFKMENYPDAISAYNQAIELDEGFGWAYSNLALTLVATGETEQAIALYQKGIGLLEDAKDKAVAWNRLGNAYRKLNQYEQALEAFHKADELDRENAGFRDNMDETAAAPTLMQTGPEGAAESLEPASVSPIELIVAESRAEEAAASAGEVSESAPEPQAEVAAVESAEPPAESIALEPAEEPAVPEITGTEGDVAALVFAEPLSGNVPPEEVEQIAEEVNTPAEAINEPARIDEPASAEEQAAEPHDAEVGKQSAEETVTVVVQDTTQTFTETLPVGETATETTDAALTSEAIEVEAGAVEAPAVSTDVVTSEQEAPADNLGLSESDEDAVFDLSDAEPVRAPMASPEPLEESLRAVAELDPAPNSLADQLLEEEPEVLDVAQHVAYEAYLKDTSDSTGSTDADEPEEVELPGSPEPMAKIDASGDLQIEMDTKNAHVWNELGNVYFNSSAYDDAIVAYSKAIELDRWFAWPYSNLALAYVQKRRFVEAILLYQRSIELFSGDKDKAISWNRLGNVYRRLNDYENAIAAYQRADALDPDNSTLSLQSRFSLLGNYAMDPKPTYVS